MLNRTLFDNAITDFLAFYNRSIENNVLASNAWYEGLSRHLTDDELIPALKKAMFRYEFCPSPEKVIETFKGSFELIALEEWLTCLELAKNGNSAKDLTLSPQGEKALRAIGGFSRFKEEEAKTLRNFVQREFIARWKEYEAAINAGVVEAPKKMLKAAPRFPTLPDEVIDWLSKAKEANLLIPFQYRYDENKLLTHACVTDGNYEPISVLMQRYSMNDLDRKIQEQGC